MDFAAAVSAAVFHADLHIDPFPNRIAGCTSGQESEQRAGEGSDTFSGCRAEYGDERADGGSRRRAGTESGISAACSGDSSGHSSNLFHAPVPHDEFARVAAWAGWYEFFHEHLLDGD